MPRRRRALHLPPPLTLADPPAVRRLAREGAAAVARHDWADPDDTRPSAARVARRVQGWRTFCPLRRMQGSSSSGIIAEHVAAADKLRELVDLARLGYSGDRANIFVHLTPQPRTTLGAAGMAQAAAGRAVTRALALFTPGQRLMLLSVILTNQSLQSWSQDRASITGRAVSAAVEKGRLLALLDLLAAHFAAEIDEEVEAGIRLPV
jgi:hypothetical protein